jgi:hypothetical protein
MKTVTTLLALTSAAALVLGGATSTAAAATPALAAATQHILAETNEARAASGLPALTLSASLSTIAQDCSNTQAAKNEMAHCLDYYTKYVDGWSFAAENVAYGYHYMAVVDGWMTSPGHRANILSRATHIGIGIAYAADGSAYYTQDFGEYLDPSGINAVDAAQPTVTPPVAAPAPETPVVKKTFTGKAKIAGTVRVGSKLTARKFRFPAGTTFTYRWTAGGKNIAGATRSTLKLTKKLTGKHIRVKVTAKKSGYTKATKTSAATKTVAKKK